MDNIKILQVVGYKNSGKTTLVKSWVKQLTKSDKGVAVIKHHGHKNGLQLPDINTDSMNFYDAGAKVSIATDEDTIQIHQKRQDWPLSKLIDMAKIIEPDVVLIEGFKKAEYEKVVIIKEQKEWEKLKNLENIVCVFSHNECDINFTKVISINDHAKINSWLIEWIGGDCDEIL